MEKPKTIYLVNHNKKTGKIANIGKLNFIMDEFPSEIGLILTYPPDEPGGVVWKKQDLELVIKFKRKGNTDVYER